MNFDLFAIKLFIICDLAVAIWLMSALAELLTGLISGLVCFMGFWVCSGLLFYANSRNENWNDWIFQQHGSWISDKGFL